MDGSVDAHCWVNQVLTRYEMFLKAMLRQRLRLSTDDLMAAAFTLSKSTPGATGSSCRHDPISILCWIRWAWFKIHLICNMDGENMVKGCERKKTGL